jgi:hypothetical protein
MDSSTCGTVHDSIALAIVTQQVPMRRSDKPDPMKTVIILGAGASRSAGGPLMFDFVESAIKLYRRGEAGWAHEDFECILEARRKLQHAYVKSTIDLDNIENLFSTYEMASLIGRLSDLREAQVANLPRRLRNMIMRTIEQSILFPLNGSDDLVPPPYPYDEFVDLLRALGHNREIAPLAVINFNYDLCLDYALTLKEIPFDYGLTSVGRRPEFLPHYKVHGSLNWFRDVSKNVIEAPALKRLPMKHYWDRLGLDRPAERPIDAVELIHGPGNWGETLLPEPVIVPPTWNKGWYQEQLKTVWRNASAALSSAENVFVIGYSLPPSDQFFRAFWSLSSISDSVIERFWLFDPSSKPDVVERYCSLLGPAIMDRRKFASHNLKFGGALKHLADSFGLEFAGSLDR